MSIKEKLLKQVNRNLAAQRANLKSYRSELLSATESKHIGEIKDNISGCEYQIKSLEANIDKINKKYTQGNK